LIYLLSIEQTLLKRPNKEDSKPFCEDGILYVDAPLERAKLVKRFYALLNNKRNNTRSGYIKEVRNGHSQNRSKLETFKPVINSNTERLSSAKRKSVSSSRKAYSNVLSQRDPKKLEKHEQLKEEYQKKEVNGCTFAPKINSKLSKLRQNSIDSFNLGDELVSTDVNLPKNTSLISSIHKSSINGRKKSISGAVQV
jgi:hypothetical protein